MKSTFEIEKPTLKDVFYHRARLQATVYHDVLERFAELAEERGFTKKQLAEAIGKDAAQVTRLFSEPGNWTLATVSDLLVGMGAYLEHRVISIKPQVCHSLSDALPQSPKIYTQAANESWLQQSTPIHSYAGQA